MRARVLRIACVALAVASCAVPPTESTTTASAPLTGVDGATDAADRACNVIMREGLPIEANGWQATIEVSSAAAASGLAPALLWQQPGQPWQSTSAVAAADDSATPGYVRYTVTLDVIDQPFVAIPYLPLAAGGRLFDHNRNPGDAANYVIGAPDYSIWLAPATCAAPTAATTATLTFAADYTQTQSGPIVAGGQLQIVYAASRLQACATPAITAHVRFDPDGEEVDPVIGAGPAIVTVPTDGAKQATIWFEATNASGCDAFDSAYGANYVFPLALPPSWLGLAQNLLTRDDSAACGGADAATGFTFDTLARDQDVVTNLCFQAYQPGETDVADTGLAQQLAASISWRLTSNTATTAWTVAPIALAGRTGNNALYTWSWRDVDPFRDFHCPELAPNATTDGMYVQLGIEYVVSVNGAEIRPEPGAAFGGTFVDYPTTPWRTANCP
jgi:hypothetical protein